MTATALVVTFQRIGRRHDVQPLTLQVDPDQYLLDYADRLAEAIHREARKYLGSGEVAVEVGIADDDPLTGHGWIIVGGVRNAGTFTFAPPPPAAPAPEVEG